MTDTMIALAGNPNSGKTTLFNAFTGARQHVGNYPGITVEKKEGFYHHGGHRIRLVDLPGTYALTAYSMEEVVARDFLVHEKPGAVIDIVDATNLERNLYLTVQFMELGVPVILALNMVDAAARRGIAVDADKLSRLLGMPVVATVARRGEGTAALAETVLDMVAGSAEYRIPAISYGPDIDPVLDEMAAAVDAAGFMADTFPARWIALKYLEEDEAVRAMGREADPRLSEALSARSSQLADHLKQTMDLTPEAVIADHRYGFIRGILRQGVISMQRDPDRLYLSDRIDQVLTHRVAGPLIMLMVVWGLYQFTFAYSETPVAWLEAFFGWLGGLAASHLSEGLLRSLVVSGVIDGVGGVLGFVPMIVFMFLGIAFLEDSGYMARMAFMLDRVFRIFGLHGSSVMPFIVSGGIAGGCAVPGIMAARTLRSPRERLATLLTVPFMNCGAKLPVFALLVGAFFPNGKALVMFLITMGAWVGALLVARLLRSTVVRGEATPFVMELPPYRMPTVKGLLIHTGERTWQYVRKAGTLILGISILLWALMTFPGLPAETREAFDAQRRAAVAATPRAALDDRLDRIDAAEAEAALRHSAAGRLGSFLAPVSQLAGFDWRTNIALIGGVAAKEVVVSTLGTAYSLGVVDPEASGSLAARLASSERWRPLTALALIVFIMFYAPCFVSVVCIARESGSWKWGLFSIVFNTILAFMLAVLVFQAGSLLGH
jgi:ferrous iron transport protein B